ncbi:MAG: PH domain-containing protein [Thermoanaerobaculia bacterium]
MDLHFEAKRDLWLSIVIWLATAMTLAAAVDGYRTDRALFASLMVAVAAVVLWILYGTYYTVSQDRLVVRSGPFRWNVALESIVSIEPTRNPFSAPATSLDRLEIVYDRGRKRLLVSPARKDEFRAAIAAARHSG